MLDLFTIFSKGGIVLWCFQGTCQSFSLPVNELIRSVIIQERGGTNSFTHGSLTLKYKLDNEFELVFVVAFQKILQLSYIDKLLDAIHLEFRDKYKNDLEKGVIGNFQFDETFHKLLRDIEFSTKVEAQVPKKMRTFGESKKSQKTVASMIISSSDKDEKSANNQAKEVPSKPTPVKENASEVTNGTCNKKTDVEDSREEILKKNREKLMKKMAGKSTTTSKVVTNGKSSPKALKDKKKQARIWENGGNMKDMKELDFSAPGSNGTDNELGTVNNATMQSMVGSMQGALKDLEYESEDEVEEMEEDEEEHANVKDSGSSGASSGGMFSFFKGLAGQKTITREDVEPILEKLRVHLISKNVASDISEKLCESVSTKLQGKVLGTFSGVASTVKASMEESLVQILSPKRRVDILRDAMDAQVHGRPFTITFCGVNGVGKSTNLAKICFWLLENNFRVLIAACDTFRAGAVEQLRTHVRHLNSLHPPKVTGSPDLVTLYEKGYGKDAASIAMDAINFAREQRIDVVLVDTAGRMQDNEPLMRALAKLIKLNNPELVLFVGEALVGNEAVDQLQKFNQALADYSNQENPRLIDGIVLTKFDTIDDKVGAAISMTYTTGKPIVFVGTGQTYKDLRNLNVKAVVHALLKA